MFNPNHSASQWLTSGGDTRLEILDCGLSKYRVSDEMRNTIPFGSCTASNPDARGMRVVEEIMGRLKKGESGDILAEEMRQQFQELFELPQHSRMVFSPSGTDVIYVLNAILASHHKKIHHIVVGAAELGGGTIAASGAQSFTTTTALDPDKEGGMPCIADRITIEPVYLRHSTGTRRAANDVDADVHRRIAVAQASRKHVVVHLVVHSKTGLRAPSLELAKRWPDVTFMVDAAQGRLAPRDIRRALSLGFTVLFTGSKFYGGPPFSGALILPKKLSADPGALPAGLTSWFSKADLPTDWVEARASLPTKSNPGLLMRWAVAMNEIQTYHQILPRKRAAVYHTFAGGFHGVFGVNPHIEIDRPIPPVHQLVTVLGAYPSVFGFSVSDENGVLQAPELKKLHMMLDTSFEEHPICFHLGQPVKLGPPKSTELTLLRVALGARLVTKLASVEDCGYGWFHDHFSALSAKLSWLIVNGKHR